MSANPTPLDPPPPTSKRQTGRRLALRSDPNARPVGYLPPEITVQGPLACAAFAMLCAKPGRSLASIARELGTSKATLTRLNQSGRWATHLKLVMQQSTEILCIAAQQEARRSRAEMLATNRLAEASIDAALMDLVEVDEHGNPRLKPGKDIQDVQRLQQARQTHVKTTAMLTGTDLAERRSVAQAGAQKVIMRIGMINGKPEQPAQGTVVEPRRP